MGIELAGFALRIAYARWLAHLWLGEAPTNAELGRAVDRTGQWATQWTRRLDAPQDPEVRRALARYLDVPEAWLFDGRGAAPEADLWARWMAARAQSAPAARSESAHGTAAPGEIRRAKSRRVLEDDTADAATPVHRRRRA